MDRFYCPELPQMGIVLLEGQEAHHLQRVLRKQPGDIVELFNGRGTAATAEIREASKRRVQLEVLETRTEKQPLGTITIATAVPKGERFRWLIEKCVELGVDRIVPLTTERSVVIPGDGKLEKMHQAVIEACKQSRRNFLMTIEPVQSLSGCLEKSTATKWIAHPDGESLSISAQKTSHEWTFFVGPEGGFSEDEISLAISHGAKPVNLGRNILRIETACVYVATFASLYHR